MSHTKNKNLIYLIVIIFFISCEGEIGPQGIGLNSLTNVTNEPAGTNCENGGIRIEVGTDSNEDGVLDSDEIQSTSYVCNGVDGAISLTTVTTEAAGTNCENGGLKINSGIDVNGDGTLDDTEISATAYVCNGIDGNNSLTKITNEVSGTNCENGGLKIDSGIDANSDGTLDDAEISATAYVCNGIDGEVSLVNISDEVAGANCENGGVKIESGIDSDGDLVLDIDEILVTRYVCNGIDGVINEEIQIKVVDGIGSAANTSSSTPVVVSGSTSFNISNFANVDSVVFVSDPYVSNTSNFALVELYNITDDVVIANSLIRANNLFDDKVQIKTDNIFSELPTKEITLGIRLSSEINGEFSASGIPYIFLYRSN